MTPRVATRSALWAFAGAFLFVSCSSPHRLTREERVARYLNYAVAAVGDGDPIGALQSLSYIADDARDIPEYHHVKSMALAAKHDTEAALNESQLAVALRHDFPEAQTTQGKLLMDLGRYDEAVRILEPAARNPLYRDAFKADTSIGVIEYRRGHYADALRALSRAIEAAPKQACLAYFYRGHIHLKLNATSLAVEDYTKASYSTCSTFADAHLALAIAYERNHDSEQARKKFLDVARHFPNTTLARQAMDHLRALP
jgi:Tfp pilus assembly protein PilF